MEFVDKRDDAHPIRWTPAGGDEPDRYLSIDEAVRRIARVQEEPDAMAVQEGLLAGQRYRTAFAFYEYEDPS